MKKTNYRILLLSIIALFILAPLAKWADWDFPVTSFLFTTMVVFMLRNMLTDTRLFAGSVILAIAAFASAVLASKNMLSPAYLVFGCLMNVLFITFFIFVILKRLMAEKKVHADTIQGGICVYFLIGFLWSLFYLIIYTVDPAAYQIHTEGAADILLFHYYSFTVLTTLGFGEIIPVNPLARNLTILEVIFGQLFLAIFIARLLGLHISKTNSE